MVLSDSESEATESDTESEKGNDVYKVVGAHNEVNIESENNYDSDEIEIQPEVVHTPPIPSRRSTRCIAGKHSNPHHIPRSAIRTQTVNPESNFQEICDF